MPKTKFARTLMIGTTHSSGDQVNSDLQARSHMGPGFFCAHAISSAHIASCVAAFANDASG
jgi:hypothetical protein